MPGRGWYTSWLQKCSFVLLVDFHPVGDIHAPTKKPERSWKFLPYFWGSKTKKKPPFDHLWPLTRPRGPFEARKGAKSCSLTNSKHIDYLIANFGPILIFFEFFGQKFRTFPGLKNVHLCYWSIFRPLGDIHAPTKKPERSWKFLPYFWAQKNPKNLFFCPFLAP